MTFRELDTVILTHDLPGTELHAGDAGAVVFVHVGTMLDVEFVRTDGTTRALLTLPAAAVRLATPGEFTSAPPA